MTARDWEPAYGYTGDNTTDVEHLVRALEHTRRLACQNNHSMGQRDNYCDCKYGLGRELLAGLHPDATDRRSRPDSEATGCPELRELIHRLLHRPETLMPTGEGHVIEFREDGWTIRHPLACRPALFDCPVNRVAERDLIRPVDVVGRFECELNDLGDRLLIGDRIEATP